MIKNHRWPLRAAYFWQEAPFFRLLLPIIAGIVIYDRQLITSVSARVLMVACIIPGLLFIAFALLRRSGNWLQTTRFLMLQAFLLCFALCMCAWLDVRRHAGWFGNHLQQDAFLVRVSEEPKVKEHSIQLTVDVLKSIQGSFAKNVSGSALLTVFGKINTATFAEGDTLLIPAQWEPIRNRGNPFEPDYVTFCRRKDLFYTEAISADSLLIVSHSTVRDLSPVQQFHKWCGRQLRRYLPDHATYGLLQAMLLGDESDFDPELRQAYSDTGVIHIVSISGSHVSVLFFVVTGLLFWLKGRQGRLIKYVVSVVLVWFYVLMAGAPPSALRSAVMFSIIALSAVTEQEGQSLNTLLAAAFVLLCAQPYWLFSVGFQLSFGAVLSLILFYGPINNSWPQTTWPGRNLWSSLAASLAAEILTAPLVIYYFHNFPLFVLIANLLAVFLIGFCVLIGGMLIIALCAIPPLARLVSWIVTQMVTGFDRVITVLQSWNPRSFKFLQITAPQLLLIYVAIAGFAVCFVAKKRAGIFVGLGAACLVLCLFCTTRWQSLQQEKFVLCNTGKANAAELISGDHNTPFEPVTLAAARILQNANTGWMAWKANAADTSTDCFKIHGQSILLLRHYQPGDDSAVFPVNILIVLQPLKGLSVTDLRQRFHPRIIVVSSNQSRWWTRRFRDSCVALHQPFHAVAEDGAFMVE